MAQQILNPEQKKQYESLHDLLQACLILTEKCSDTGAYKIVRDKLSHMQSAALLVIVGEVKSGKSSFINALLGEKKAVSQNSANIYGALFRLEKSGGLNWRARVILP